MPSGFLLNLVGSVVACCGLVGPSGARFGELVASIGEGVRTVQQLTFDCRWWNNNLHGNSQSCHDGLVGINLASLIG